MQAAKLLPSSTAILSPLTSCRRHKRLRVSTSLAVQMPLRPFLSPSRLALLITELRLLPIIPLISFAVSLDQRALSRSASPSVHWRLFTLFRFTFLASRDHQALWVAPANRLTTRLQRTKNKLMRQAQRAAEKT